MQAVNIVYWEEEDGWIGYLQEFPDYWTQGETLDDLKEHLKDLYKDLTSGEIPGVRRVGELMVS
jgi:predicted RNase H-like HicB family nuclease